MTSTSLELNVKKSLAAISAVFSAVLLSTATVLNGADLVLAEKGRTDKIGPVQHRSR
jgi:hypothetical protein